MTRPLPPLADLPSVLDGGAAALPFAAAVVRQLAHHPAGAAPDAGAERVAAQVVELLRLARRARPADPGPERAGERLAADMALLAAFFQNVDLLYDHAYPHADAVSLAIMHGVSLLEA